MTHDPSTHAPLIFVYGTLRRGGSNHFRMDGCEFIAPATVNGHLYRVAWYPGLVVDPAGRQVVGEIYRVPGDILHDLDDYEGPKYWRTRTLATRDDGSTDEVWVWEWRESTDLLSPVACSDWLRVQPSRDD